MTEKTAQKEPGKKPVPSKKPKPQQEVVVQIPLSELHPFPDHPFQVREDASIIPTSFRFIVRADKQKQFDILRELMRREDVAEVVNACDAGREGELIFRTVYCLAGCSKPILRLWISSMEDDVIRSGFQQLNRHKVCLALEEIYKEQSEFIDIVECDEFYIPVSFKGKRYAKTRDTYVAYRKAGYSKKFLAEHESEITIHKAAKNYFDGLGFKKLPTIKALNTEYAELLAEKKAAYADYRKAREEMKELLTAKANIDRILELDKEQEEANERREKEAEQR